MNKIQRRPAFQKRASDVTKEAVQDVINKGQNMLDKIKKIRDSIENP